MRVLSGTVCPRIFLAVALISVVCITVIGNGLACDEKFRVTDSTGGTSSINTSTLAVSAEITVLVVSDIFWTTAIIVANPCSPSSQKVVFATPLLSVGTLRSILPILARKLTILPGMAKPSPSLTVTLI